jgi:hypothetical protein
MEVQEPGTTIGTKICSNQPCHNKGIHGDILSHMALAGGTGQNGGQQIHKNTDVPILVGVHSANSDAFCDDMENGPQRRTPGIRISVSSIGSD